MKYFILPYSRDTGLILFNWKLTDDPSADNDLISVKQQAHAQTDDE